jgi:glucuronoarabinoxylan endo-1,4-beta-xylanase
MTFSARLGALALALISAACGPSKGPEAGSQTNWLVACATADDCGELQCVCGVCTAICASDATCADLESASCIPAGDEGAIALCGGTAPEEGLCLPRCVASCAEDTSCVAGVCTPDTVDAVQVAIDTDTRDQALLGFGASLAYADDAIVAHSDKAALFDLAFEAAGLDVIRISNRYESADSAPLDAAREIVAEATDRLGRRPILLLTSGTPPAALKANASRMCAGEAATCTLVSRAGSFDYAGFASYWRGSLEAYASADILPDYVSIQNNPNWVPPAATPLEACRFSPEESAEYPGYREALAAVRAAIADLPVVPQIAAPETSGLMDLRAYATTLDAASLDALALHLYGVDPQDVDIAALQAIAQLARDLDRPVLQTEMRVGGLDTAVLAHHALTAARASAYLQNDLVSLTEEVAELALFLLADEGVTPQPPYYALMHYAKHTDPEWLRVDARSASDTMLASAWLAPDARALTIVLVNPGSQPLSARLALDATPFAAGARSEVSRTVFEGVERFAPLGALPSSGVVRLPPRSIATVALTLD